MSLKGIQVPICYVFGQNSKGQQIIFSFNPITRSFQNVPKPRNLNVWCFTGCVYLSPNHIFLTGGINYQFNSITAEAYLYDPQRGIAGILPPMRCPRYTHINTYWLGRLYCFGGRTYGEDEVAILNRCEYFDLQMQQWIEMPPMNIPRSTGFACIYKDEIYVLGGYTGPYQRKRNIEKYHPMYNKWEMLSIKLHRGIDGGVILPGELNNELIIVGGKMQAGAVKELNVYDLAQQTVHHRPGLNRPRILNKGFQHQGYLYVFGGDEDYTLESCFLQKWQWDFYENVSFFNFCDAKQIENFQHAYPPCWVCDGPSVRYKCPYVSENVYLFGTDCEPFIMEFNMTTGQAVSKPVPLQMRLFTHQGGVALGQGKFLLMGGVRDFFDKVSKHSYIYDANDEIAMRLPNMIYQVYSFSTAYLSPYVYVIAGRQEGEEDLKAIVKRCQRYNLQLSQWEEIASLNFLRVDSMTLIFQGRIYVLGGYRGEGERPLEVEVYDQQANNWIIVDFKMPFGIEGSPYTYLGPQQALFFGGWGDDERMDQIWLFQINGDISGNGNFVNGSFTKIGQLEEKKCKSKVYKPIGSQWIVIFGGNEKHPIHCYNTYNNSIESNVVLDKVIANFSNVLIKLNDPYMEKYLFLY